MSDETNPQPPEPSPTRGKNLLFIAGPCSAESRDQLLETALALRHLPLTYFRAGFWKPRTRPGHFEGVGEKGLPWLAEVRKETSLPIMTEVSLPQHVEKALGISIDALWVGARTVSDPFSVQNLADALRGSQLPLFIKNPISPDLNLWIGAFERFLRAGVTNLYAIFRGFSPNYSSKLSYRNTPLWSIAFELQRALPDIAIIADPSHITGRKKEVERVAREAVELGFDGIMVETHICPSEAMSDAMQQITPDDLERLIAMVEKHHRTTHPRLSELDGYRKLLAEIDEVLLATLARRLEVARAIGSYKHEHQIPILQLEYFSKLLERNCQRASELQLPEGFVRQLYAEIHELSTKIQLEASQESDSSTDKNRIDKQETFLK